MTDDHSDDEWAKFMSSLEELVHEDNDWAEMDEHDKLMDTRLRTLMLLLLAALFIIAVACVVAAMAR